MKNETTPSTPRGSERHCAVCRTIVPGWFVPARIDNCERCKSPVPHYSIDSCRSGGMRPHRNCSGRAHCTCDTCF